MNKHGINLFVNAARATLIMSVLGEVPVVFPSTSIPPFKRCLI